MKSGCPDRYGSWGLSPYFPYETSPAQVSLSFIFHLRVPENTWTTWPLKSKWAVGRLLLIPGVLSKMIREQAWVTWQRRQPQDGHFWALGSSARLRTKAIFLLKKKICFVNWSQWATDYFLRGHESEETEGRAWIRELSRWAGCCFYVSGTVATPDLLPASTSDCPSAAPASTQGDECCFY